MLKLARLVTSSLRRDEGMALVGVVFLTLIMSVLITGVIANSMHSNDATTLDKHKEDAFQTASAGIDDALDCLAQLGSTSAFSTCSRPADPGTILSDGTTNVGQFSYAVTELATVLPAVRVAKITSTGNAPSLADNRGTRYVTAEVNMVPVGGFFDTIFAGGPSPSGVVHFKNGATVNGSTYAGSFDTEKNGGIYGDSRVVGDFVSKNGDQYKSVWAGGNMLIGNNTVIQTTAKACGAGSSNGNATVNNSASITGNLQYKGTLVNGGSVGSLTHAACSAPLSLDIPTFTYAAANYPGWTIVTFDSAHAANACLVTVGSTQADQVAACGSALGDSNRSVGKNASGTLIHVSAPGCTTPVSMGSATYTGNFTLVSTCPLALGGTLSKSASAIGPKKAAFMATGGNLDPGGLTSSSTSLSVLLYATGTIGPGKKVRIASGSMYARTIDMQGGSGNAVEISASADLGFNPPAGFTFDPAVASTFTPVVREWRETSS